MLSDINSEAAKLRERIVRLNEKVSETNSEIEALHQEKATIYLNLAELRYDLLDNNTATGKLYKAEEEARSYLGQRQSTRQQLDKELEKNQSQQLSLEQKRKTVQDRIDNFATKIKNAEEKTLKALEKSPEYKAGQNQLEMTELQILRIESKIILAREDYEAKVIPYYADPLFKYLWDSGYGTSAYKKSGLSRLMDAWVADVADYEPARRNYAMLSGIPEKLELHKNYLEERIIELDKQMAHLEETAFEKDGILVMRHEYLAKRNALLQIDTELKQLEVRYHEILAQKEKFSSNTDQFYSGAIKKLNDLYQSKSLFNLRRNAAATPTKEDDKLIRSLFEIDKYLEKLEDELSEYKSSLRQEEWRLTEVQNVRQTFKDKKYDSKQTTFRDGNMFSVLLGQFVVGIITNEYFWRAVGNLCAEIFDELDLDDLFDVDDLFENDKRKYRKRRSRKSRSSRSKSKGGFRTGGRF